MQHIKINFAALFLLLALGACNKTKPYVAGRVSEAGTDKPIADARVFLTGCTGQLFGSLDCSVVDSTRSADDGTYRINGIEPQLADLITAVAPGYFSDMDSQASVPGDEFNPNINVKLFPHAWIRVKIINESGLSGFGSSQLLNGIINQQVGDTHEVIKLVKGNTEYKILFFLLDAQGQSTYSSGHLRAFNALGQTLPIDIDNSMDIRPYATGHDTTEVTIIY